MNLIQESDKERASFRVVEILKEIVSGKPDATVIFPGGNTTIPLYEKIREKKELFGKIRIIQLDEILNVSPQDSICEFLNNQLVKPLKIPKENFLFFSGSGDKKDLGVHAKRLRELGDVDLAILGLGLNGHIGFNEPGSSVLSETRIVTLSELSIATLIKNGVKDPKDAVTLGLKTIGKSKRVVLFATSESKARVVASFIKSGVTVDIPATILKKHPDFTFVTDRASFSLVKSPIINDINILTKYPENKVVAVISPHPDDSAFSAGGTIALLSKNNLVYTIVLTSGYRSIIEGKKRSLSARQRKNEAISEAKILNSKILFENCKFYNSDQIPSQDIENLAKTLLSIQPDIIMLPDRDDFHPTHQKSYLVSKRAIIKYLKKHPTPIELWHYETPWRIFNINEFNLIVSITPTIMMKKIQAIMKHKSQILRTPFHGMAKGLATFNAGRVPEIMENNFGKKSNFPYKFVELFDRWKIC